MMAGALLQHTVVLRGVSTGCSLEFSSETVADLQVRVLAPPGDQQRVALDLDVEPLGHPPLVAEQVVQLAQVARVADDVG